MEKESQVRYEVVFTPTAQSQFVQVIGYMYECHSMERAEELAEELYDLALSLDTLPFRGARERILSARRYDYRFLLFQRTQRAQIKIIYFVDEPTKRVIVTDFIGTEEDGDKLAERNM